MTIDISGTQEEVTAFLHSMGETYIALEEMQEQEETHD